MLPFLELRSGTERSCVKISPSLGGGWVKRSPEEMHVADYKAVNNSLTTDLKLCYVFLAGRVGWRGVEKIRLVGVGSACR